VIHIFHGPDTFSQREALEAAKGALGDPGLLEASTTRLEGKALSPQELALACHTAPFLTPSRLVVVTGLLERFEPRGGERAPDPGPFLPALEGLPPTTELFLVEARTLRTLQHAHAQWNELWRQGWVLFTRKPPLNEKGTPADDRFIKLQRGVEELENNEGLRRAEGLLD